MARTAIGVAIGVADGAAGVFEPYPREDEWTSATLGGGGLETVQVVPVADA